jgi:hypothetical protein
MSLGKPYNVVVCLVFLLAIAATGAHAYSMVQAAAPPASEDIYAPTIAKADQPAQAPAKAQANPKKIAKTKPIYKVRPTETVAYAYRPKCILPQTAVRGWELDAQVIFARTKGTVRYMRGIFGGFGFLGFYNEDLDLNADLGLPDHDVMPMFTAAYRFRPNWAVRYSYMPMEASSSPSLNRPFVFGNNTYTQGQNMRAKWERAQHQVGLVYDPIHTYASRLSIFGEYVRIDEKISLGQPGCCGDTFYNELNMGMAGLEFVKCLKTGPYCNTFSLECKAGIAFFDDAFGSDVSSGIKYTIPMSRGRWGYVEGGYRYLTYKKNYSDATRIDTAMDGGYLKVGFLF